MRAIVAALVLMLSAEATAAPVPRAKPDTVPARSTAEIVAEHPVTGALGYILFDPATGETLDGLNAGQSFIPASVSKITAALRSLDRFAEDARFSTRLAAMGTVAEGALNGDLYLVGGGDPTLDTAGLAQLAKELRARGIRRITGRFLYDDAVAPGARRISELQAEQASYNPSLSGLNLNFNRVRARWSTKGGKISLRAEAQADRVNAPAPSVRLAIGGDFRHRVTAEAEEWTLPKSALRRAGSRWLPVRRPALYAATTFRHLAKQQGIALPAPDRAALPDAAETLFALESAPVDEITARMMEFSTNLTAEALGIAAATPRGATPRTIAEAARDTEGWLRARDLETDWGGFVLANHSGLSIRSRATPRQAMALVRIGLALHGGRFEGMLFDEVLGPDGLRAHRAIAPAYGLRAKSGTMHFVRGLAGILQVEGRPYLFAIMSQDTERRAGVDAAFSRYSESAPRGARAWLQTALNRERAILRNWVYTLAAR